MKLVMGIVLSALIMGFFAGSIIAYPSGAVDAVNNPWEAIQLTAYKIIGQEEKAAVIEEKIENRQQSPEELGELPKE